MKSISLSVSGLALILTGGLLVPQATAYTAYVSNEKGNSITIVDLDKMAVTGTVPVGARPRGITLSHDKKQLFICTSDADHIEVLDLDSLKVVNILPSGPDPE